VIFAIVFQITSKTELAFWLLLQELLKASDARSGFDFDFDFLFSDKPCD